MRMLRRLAGCFAVALLLASPAPGLAAEATQPAAAPVPATAAPAKEAATTAPATPAVAPAKACDAVVADVDKALLSNDLGALDQLWTKAKAVTDCPEPTRYCMGQAIALAVLDDAKAFAEKPDSGTGDIAARITAALKYGSPWQVHVALGDVHLAVARGTHKGLDYSDAAYAYQQALLDLQAVAVCADASEQPSVATVGSVYTHMAAALLLADPVKFVVTRCASCPWLLFRGIAGFRPAVRPLPITFPSGSDQPTAEGEATIGDIATCLGQSRASGIVLLGHADATGGDAANMRLSKKRLETIRAMLIKAGYRGKVGIEPQGSSKPFVIEDGNFSAAETLRLDRRIELAEADFSGGGSCE